ncbi:MAG: hypothetical protein MUD08_04230 [Cytophagales bacterium]|nr:hypothetical protein [Cytophagales bacterium]
MHGCGNPAQAFSHRIMRIAKVSAPAACHKCVRDLDVFGYIRHEPSFKRDKGNRIHFVNHCTEDFNKCKNLQSPLLGFRFEGGVRWRSEGLQT